MFMRSNKKQNKDQFLKKYWKGILGNLDEIKKQNAESDMTFTPAVEIFNVQFWDVQVPTENLSSDPNAFLEEMTESELDEIAVLNNPAELKMQSRF